VGFVLLSEVCALSYVRKCCACACCVYAACLCCVRVAYLCCVCIACLCCVCVACLCCVSACCVCVRVCVCFAHACCVCWLFALQLSGVNWPICLILLQVHTHPTLSEVMDSAFKQAVAMSSH